MKLILFFLVILLHNILVAKENVIWNAFDHFYPSMSNNICRLRAYEMATNQYGDTLEKKIAYWQHYAQQCSYDGSYQLVLADVYISYGCYNEAKQLLEDTISHANYDIRYHNLLLHGAYIGLKQHQKAINLAKKMIINYPGWSKGYTSLGIDYFNQQQWKTAKSYFEKAITLNGHDDVEYLMLASTCYELCEYDRVPNLYYKAFDFDPKAPFLDRSSSAACVIVLINQGKFEEAINIISTQEEVDPGVVKKDRFIKIKEHYEAKLYEKALAFYAYVAANKMVYLWETHRKKYFDNSNVVILNKCYKSDSYYAKAKQFLKKIIFGKKEKTYDIFDTFFPHLGNNICRFKAYEIAINKYNSSPQEKINAWKSYEREYSDDGSYQLILSDIYLSCGFYTSAKQILEDSILKANYDTRYHKLWLHGAYLYLYEIDTAKALAEQMINDYPDWFEGLVALGNYYFYLKKYDIAKQYLEKALVLNNKDVDTYLMLEYIAYVTNQPAEQVINYYEQAIALDPLRTILDRRSCAVQVASLVKLKNFKYAKSILDEQQKIDPEVAKEDRFFRVTTYYEEALQKYESSRQ